MQVAWSKVANQCFDRTLFDDQRDCGHFSTKTNVSTNNVTVDIFSTKTNVSTNNVTTQTQTMSARNVLLSSHQYSEGA